MKPLFADPILKAVVRTEVRGATQEPSPSEIQLGIQTKRRRPVKKFTPFIVLFVALLAVVISVGGGCTPPMPPGDSEGVSGDMDPSSDPGGAERDPICVGDHAEDASGRAGGS